MSAPLREAAITAKRVGIVVKQVETLRFRVVPQDDAVAGADFATSNPAREASQWAIRLNWHLNRTIKASVNHLGTEFKGGGKAKGEVTAQDEEAIFARIQFAF